MRTLFFISHPAYFYFYKNIIEEQKRKGYEVLVVARDKDITIDLLNQYNIEHRTIKKPSKSLIGKVLELPYVDYKLYKLAKAFKPDVLTAAVGIHISQVGKLLNIPSLVFDDTEHAKYQLALMKPFASVICTPDCYLLEFGEKHVKFPGYKELAYLHPNNFKPDPTVIKRLGLNEGERFFVLRFVSLTATHDMSEVGIGNKREIVDRLVKSGKVFISSEEPLSEELKKYELNAPIHEMHSILYYATMFLGESATMSSEAACLGTPAIFISESTRGYIEDLEKKYGLVFRFFGKNAENQALAKAEELLKDTSLEARCLDKKKTLLENKCDVTQWMLDFIDNFVQSNH